MAQAILSASVVLVGGFTKPLCGYTEILLYALAVLIHYADIKLGVSEAHFCCF